MSARILHQFLWLLRAHPGTHAVYALAWIALSIAGWSSPAILSQTGFLHNGNFGLMVVALGLAGEAGWQKSATDSNVAWRTRPPRWLEVWLALLAYCAALAVPPFACLTVTGILLDQTAEQWRLLATDAGFFLAGTFVMCALAGMSGGVSSSGAAVLLGGLCFAGGAILGFAGEHFVRERMLLESPVPVALTTVAGFLWLWAMYLRQRAGLREVIIAWVWVTIGPLLLWMAVFRWRSEEPTYFYSWSDAPQKAFLRGQFPERTRFYSDNITLIDPRLEGNSREQRSRRPLPPLRLPLAAGAEATANGTRLHITEVEHGELNLEVTLQGRHASVIPIPGAGMAGYSREGVFFLYLPAVPMVVDSASTQTRTASLRHLTSETTIRVTMPDAEALRGIRWTPETMAGAQLYYFDSEKH